MASGTVENGNEVYLPHTSSVNLKHEAGAPHDVPPLSMPIHHGIPNDPPQSRATLVPPLASYSPMGLNYIYYAVPPPCAPSEKIIANGLPNGSLSECDLDGEEDKKQPDKEHKRRSKNWTRHETLKLIQLRTELAPKFNKSGRKSELWEQIANSLQQEQITRDAQQCRDKWEKLMAGFKEVKDGVKDREEYPFYEELYPLISGKHFRKEKDMEPNETGVHSAQIGTKETEKAEKEASYTRLDTGSDGDEDVTGEKGPPHKKRKYVAVVDLQAVRTMLEMVASQQQKIFKDFLDAWERKEQQREQIRQEREEKWRAEELAQSRILNDVMIVLMQKLVGERAGAASTSMFPTAAVCTPPSHPCQVGPMKRSKNWRRAEVLQLIKMRGEMESRFAKSTRRAALWDELSDMLDRQGIKRDGKQCREKWDKLMAEYKDVIEGKREEGDSSYFQDLTAVVRSRPPDTG